MTPPVAGGSAAVRPHLIGRTRETAALNALLDAVRRGMSGKLLIRGEAGIGKTALLEHLISTASDFRVIKALGIESEMSLGFAGLHQLIVPFLPKVDRLPVPQRDALAVAFGLAPGPTPERFQVGLATLTLLAAAAADKPLVAIVDDAQWLDIESAEVLAFVARRLQAEGIAMIFGLRDPMDRPISFAGIPELRLGPLEDEAARELLATVVSRPLDEPAWRRLFDETEGNPLAILELGGELAGTQIAGPTPLAEPLPVGPRLQQHFLRQLGELGADAQTFLRLASGESSSDPVVLWRAARDLGLDKDVFVEAEAKRLIVVGPLVSFRHPLIRSAIYHGMAAAERRRIHAALARVTDPKIDPERHAAHRALATVEPDEEVAADLAQCAERAQERGAYAAWAAFASRAAELTPDPQVRAARLLSASEASMTAGQLVRAQASLDQAMPALRDPLQQATAQALAGSIRVARGEGGDTPRILLNAARTMAALDPGRAVRILANALQAATFTQPDMKGSLMRDIAAEVPALVSLPQSPPALILRGYATVVMSGYTAAAPILKQAIAATLRDGTDPDAPHRLASLAAYSLFDDRAVHLLATDWVRVTRERAALIALPIALNFLASVELHFGRLDESEALFKQSMEISEATDNPGIFGSASRGDVLVIAWRGSEAQARERAAAHVAEARERGQVYWANFAGFALTALELALGRYRPALEAALPTYNDDPPYAGSWVLPGLIEAAVRIGDEDIANAALTRLTDRAVAGATPLGLGLLARCRALLADDSEAESLYRHAIDELGRSPTEPELGRTRLLYGEWLRRQNRRREAREELRMAFEMFSRMGINAFAERARVELLATGERVRRRTIETQDQLSAQELQIARRAAEGVHNQEIASQLFISERTVEYHLAKVFRKLDVSSRTELAHAPQVVGAQLH